ncbi:MAG: hypothetical protein H7Z12_20105 [Rhodospirillaceae bacterium]|nr:hypothetical protein [Rhodospirillales bacterium]
MFAGQFMMGAQDRLLPPSIPFRFFATAIVFHLAGWAVLLAGADDLSGFMGGLGLGLAGLHLITLGVLAMTAMGAAFQLLPVATSRQLGPNWACRLTWWIYTPGVGVLCLGMATQWMWALHLGGTLVAVGLAVFGVLVGRNLLQVSELPGVTRHAWVALASLAGLAVLGLALIADFQSGFLPDHTSLAAAHAILAGYGFMGSLALGFSYVLVPMFVLSQGVSDRDGRRTATLTALALAVAAIGAALGNGMAAALGGVIGLIAIGLHLRALLAVLETRMRKRLETFFRMVKAAWIMLPVTVLMGLFLALGSSPELTAPLWGWLLVFGWLLTFVTGILQRIMPFLASMHSGANGGKPALMSRLVADRPLLIHAIAHGLAVILVAAGLLAQAPLLVRAGAASGLIGAISFTLFAVELMRRYRAHETANSRHKGPSSC